MPCAAGQEEALFSTGAHLEPPESRAQIGLMRGSHIFCVFACSLSVPTLVRGGWRLCFSHEA